MVFQPEWFYSARAVSLSPLAAEKMVFQRYRFYLVLIGRFLRPTRRLIEPIPLKCNPYAPVHLLHRTILLGLRMTEYEKAVFMDALSNLYFGPIFKSIHINRHPATIQQNSAVLVQIR